MVLCILFTLVLSKFTMTECKDFIVNYKGGSGQASAQSHKKSLAHVLANTGITQSTCDRSCHVGGFNVGIAACRPLLPKC